MELSLTEIASALRAVSDKHHATGDHDVGDALQLSVECVEEAVKILSDRGIEAKVQFSDPNIAKA